VEPDWTADSGKKETEYGVGREESVLRIPARQQAIGYAGLALAFSVNGGVFLPSRDQKWLQYLVFPWMILRNDS
jgi:hypothetical protein